MQQRVGGVDTTKIEAEGNEETANGERIKPFSRGTRKPEPRSSALAKGSSKLPSYVSVRNGAFDLDHTKVASQGSRKEASKQKRGASQLRIPADPSETSYDNRDKSFHSRALDTAKKSRSRNGSRENSAMGLRRSRERSYSKHTVVSASKS